MHPGSFFRRISSSSRVHPHMWYGRCWQEYAAIKGVGVLILAMAMAMAMASGVLSGCSPTAMLNARADTALDVSWRGGHAIRLRRSPRVRRLHASPLHRRRVLLRRWLAKRRSRRLPVCRRGAGVARLRRGRGASCRLGAGACGGVRRRPRTDLSDGAFGWRADRDAPRDRRPFPRGARVRQARYRWRDRSCRPL